MDWYEEGRRWMNRSMTREGERLYGTFSRTHLRALLRLTRTSSEWLAAREGFYARMREIGQMSWLEFDAFYQGGR